MWRFQDGVAKFVFKECNFRIVGYRVLEINFIDSIMLAEKRQQNCQEGHLISSAVDQVFNFFWVDLRPGSLGLECADVDADATGYGVG